MGEKLQFRVSYSSSEDPGYPSSELNEHGPRTLGWQSLKFCDYPQEVGFELLEGEMLLSQIQLLSHQFKIASRIELYIGSGLDYGSSKFERLGYLALDVNERSNLTARELKTVLIEDRPARFLKLVIHRPHKNSQNLFQQVGIIAINVMGQSKDSAAMAAAAEAKAESKAPPTAAELMNSAASAISNYVHEIRTTANGMGNGMQHQFCMDAQTSRRLKYLAEAKASAILSEDYARAKDVKMLEMECRANGARLAQLDVAKADAVRSEDFDLAKELKQQADTLRNEMDAKIAELFGPAGMPASRPPSQAEADGKGGRKGGGASTKADSKLESSNKAQQQEEGAAGLINSRADSKAELKPSSNDDVPVGGGASPTASASALPKWDPSGPAALDEESASAAPAVPPEHPLLGVPDYEDLPEPEELEGEHQALAEHSGLLVLFGEYRTACLFSKVWALREAVLSKVRLMVAPGTPFAQANEIETIIAEIATLVRLGCDDKAQQVLFKAVGLLGDVLGQLRGAHLPRSVLVPFLEPIAAILVEKLADGNHRFREGARRGIDELANSDSVGPAMVIQHVLKPLPDVLKHRNAWRPLVCRLQLLREFVSIYGFGGGAGFNPESVMSFIKSNSCYSHPHAEVRDAARELTVAVQMLVGSAVIDDYLKLLRPKQLEEYQQCFAKAAEAAKTHSKVMHEFTGNDKHDMSPRSKRRQQHGDQTKVNTAAARAEAKSAFVEDDGSRDFTKCMFCGAGAPHWNEDALDLHYWQDCAMLVPCPACAQVVEVAGLPEHLLGECEYKEAFVHCNKTGLAVRRNEWPAWQTSSNYQVPPEGSFYCPLCMGVTEDTDAAWRKHLLYACKGNARGSYSPSKHSTAGGAGHDSQPHWYAL